jgi:hypothetical protein
MCCVVEIQGTVLSSLQSSFRAEARPRPGRAPRGSNEGETYDMAPLARLMFIRRNVGRAVRYTIVTPGSVTVSWAGFEDMNEAGSPGNLCLTPYARESTCCTRRVYPAVWCGSLRGAARSLRRTSCGASAAPHTVQQDSGRAAAGRCGVSGGDDLQNEVLQRRRPAEGHAAGHTRDL